MKCPATGLDCIICEVTCGCLNVTEFPVVPRDGPMKWEISYPSYPEFRADVLAKINKQ